MPEDNEHCGGSPPEAPPPEVEGAARFKDFRVDEKGNFWSGNECIEKAPTELLHPKDEGLQTKIRVGDEELSVEEIAALKRDADEVRRLKEEIEPYSAILKDQRMHDLIRQGQEEGYWQGPTIPVAEPEDMGRYKALQNSDPMFNDTREAMATYATNLTVEQQQALDSNPSYFIQIYEKVRKTVGDKPSARRATPVDDIIRSIQRKEAAKNTAVLQRPGGGDYESSDRAAERRSYKADLKLLQSGNNDDIANVLMKRVFRQGNE